MLNKHLLSEKGKFFLTCLLVNGASGSAEPNKSMRMECTATLLPELNGIKGCVSDAWNLEAGIINGKNWYEENDCV